MLPFSPSFKVPNWPRSQPGGLLWAEETKSLCARQSRVRPGCKFFSLAHVTPSLGPFLLRTPLHLLLCARGEGGLTWPAWRVESTWGPFSTCSKGLGLHGDPEPPGPLLLVGGKLRMPCKLPGEPRKSRRAVLDPSRGPPRLDSCISHLGNSVCV